MADRRLANKRRLSIGKLILLGFLTLSAFQTWELVVLLFPDDHWIFRVITMASFDCAALFWIYIDSKHSFGSRTAKYMVRVTAILTTMLSIAASALSFYLQWIARFHLRFNPVWVLNGMWMSLATLGLNLVCLIVWQYFEDKAEHPLKDTITRKEKAKAARELREAGFYKRGNSRRG